MFTDVVPVKLCAETPPILLVVIDTEEEFDWGLPPDRQQVSVKHLLHVERVQSIFDAYGIVPCYAVDYPVASSQDCIELLRSYSQAQKCEIGAHLQPWVNPPHDEVLSFHNMFPGNLPVALEKQKLQCLTEAITNAFGTAPISYKAGRYGLGPNSARILHELGYKIDLSVSPCFNHNAEGGPNFQHFDSQPFFFGQNPILEIPLTSGLVGWSGAMRPALFSLGQKFAPFKAQGALSKLGAVDRLVLSPEGYSDSEHKKITETLLKQGCRCFTWSFHSPSIEPGHTPYVKNQRELEQFLGSFQRFFDFFFGELQGQAMSPSQFLAHIQQQPQVAD
ncbi:MAG: polysaccharide deacetylase family protein [Alkalimonas sp.]|nr:polysaccharide deacetylase family protein [Alkalimonas sp.]